MRLRTPLCVSRCGAGMVERLAADDDLLKRLRALARGKHDDFSVVFEALKEIERLQQVCRSVEAKEGLA